MVGGRSSVGVVIAVRGPAPYLADALDGIARQTVPPGQVVVVDDASPDPVEVPGVELVRRPERGGPGGARNTGVGRLATEWVAFCDADDVWSPDKLAEQQRVLQADPGIDVCVGTAAIVAADGRATGERWPALDPRPAGLVERLYEANPILLSSAVVRRRVLEDAGGFDASFARAGDWELWLRLAASGARFAVAPGALVTYRRHAGGVTADVAALARAQLELHDRHAGLVDETVRRKARHRDLLGLADGLLAERDWVAARGAVREAATLGPLPPRMRARAALSAVPAARGLLGHKDPYA